MATMMAEADAAVRSEFLRALARVAPAAPRALVLVHVPKTAGTAVTRTAELAGWQVLALEQLRRRRGRCDQCAGSCDRGARWDPDASVGAVGGLLVTVGHRPLEAGIEAAAVLRAAGIATPVVMAVRDPLERLASMFRFYWRNAVAGGVEGFARAASRGRRRLAGLGLAKVIGGTRLRRALGTTHRRRTDRGFALNGLHYATVGRDGLFIDGRRWLEAFATLGPGVPFWLEEFAGTPERLRTLRDAGAVEVIATSGLDRFAITTFGRPAVRANVSIDAPHPAVVTALDAVQDDLERVAARDAPFGALIREAGS